MVGAAGPRAPPWVGLHVPGPALQLLGQKAELITWRAEQQYRDALPAAAAGLLDPGAHRIQPAAGDAAEYP
jgi:hypothetical protein